MAHAEMMSGTVALLGRDTAPCEPEQTHLPGPTTPFCRRVTDAAVEERAVSPPREEKTVTAERLSFPLPMVAAIVATAVAVSGAQYLAQAGLRSDVRDILTRMELQAKIDESSAKALDAKFMDMKEKVDALTREDRLRQYDLKTLDTRVDAIEKEVKR